MNLVLSYPERQRALQLIRRTAKDGADGALEVLGHFHPDRHPALIAFLAHLACGASSRSRPAKNGTYRGEPIPPERLTPEERKAYHAAWKRGERTPEVIAGEREYQRIRNRQRRAAT